MKNVAFGLAALLVGILVAGAGNAPTASAQIARPSFGSGAPRRAPWDYKVVEVNDNGSPDGAASRLQAQLDALAAENWDLVQMPTLKGGRQVLVLKRNAYQ